MPPTDLLVPKLHSPAKLLDCLRDAHGCPIAECSFFPAECVLYVQWHGHLTSTEVIRVAEIGLQWHARLHPRAVLNDKRLVSGEWGDALPWLEYEWAPRVKAEGLRAFAYVINPELMVSFDNVDMVNRLRRVLDLRTFYNVPAAWKWLRQHPGLLAAQAARYQST